MLRLVKKESIGEMFFIIGVWIPLCGNIVSPHIVYIFKTTITCSKLTVETLEQVVKYVHS